MSETALDPEDVAGHVTLAHKPTEEGASPEAFAAVQAAIRLSPDDSALYGLLGFHLAVQARQNGDRAGTRGDKVEVEAAAAAFQRAIELDPTNAYALSYLGMLEWWLGNKAEAIQLLKASIAAGATDFKTHIELHWYQSRTRDYRGMMRTIKAINALPDSEERDEYYRQVYRCGNCVKAGLAVATGLAAFLIWRKWRGSSR